MGITSSGIGSGLDVDGLVSKLMAAESAPLSNYDRKTAAFQSKLDAFGKLGSAIGAFQSSLASLSTPATFRAVSTSVSNKDVLSGSATSDAAPGTYKVSVSQLAQAQSLITNGLASTTGMVGGGTRATLTFQFGTISGGPFGMSGTALPASSATGGIANGSLTINGAAIVTGASTTSAKDLADAINAQSETTGVNATAAATATSSTLFGSAGASTFGAVATGATGAYTLSVGGVAIARQGAGVAAGAGVTAASVDAALGSDPATGAALAAAHITFSGTAAGGNLRFFAADGSNISVTETASGASGGIGKAPGTANAGSSVTATSSVSLASPSGTAVVIGGSAPALAGLTAGSGGGYIGAGFTQDGTHASGTVTLEPGDQSLQGIRDAINKANVGVQASIVSDGSDKPYRLVLTSASTGANSNMKISLAGDGGLAADPALASLLGYDPAGAQQLHQTSAGQNTLLNVNGVAVTSSSNSVSGAIQGVTLNVAQEGSSTVTIAKDTATVTNSVNAFVKAYNDLNKTMQSLTSYDPATKKGGALQGDATVRSIQSELRGMLGKAVGGAKLTSLSQVGIAFQKDGSLAVDSTKLQKAMTDSFADIGGLFAAVGTSSDSLVKFNSSTSATKPGSYAVNITQMATKGSLTSAAAIAPSTTIAPNTTWTVTLNQTDPVTAAKVQNISLAAGTYTPTQLSALLNAAINGNTGFADSGDTVDAAIDASGKLALSSSKWGSTSNISVSGLTGSAVSDVFGAATPAAGLDVAGTIGEVAATGSGQSLLAAPGSGADGLKLDITGGNTGARGSVTFSQGYAYQLNNLATSFLGKDGLITGKADGLNLSIKSVATSRDAFSVRLDDMEKRYRTQFTALDTMLASMQSTSSYLTQQLAALAANR